MIFNTDSQKFKSMKKQEREFLEDIEDALGDWEYQTDAYHENEYFCVDVTIDMDDWGGNADEIWDALSDVASEWGAGIDSDMNTYYLAL